jgi:hypothetical protein
MGNVDITCDETTPPRHTLSVVRVISTCVAGSFNYILDYSFYIFVPHITDIAPPPPANMERKIYLSLSPFHCSFSLFMSLK